MKAPGWDAEFAKSPMHGEAAQRIIFREVLPFLKDRRVAIDVGAHIGLWTAMLARTFRHVKAFEPVHENYKCLESNVMEYNVDMYNAAIGEANGSCEMKLKESKDNSGCWHAEPGDEIPVFALDAFEYPLPVDFIKIDVEGAEGSVLAGANHILRYDRPVVIFESNGLGQKNMGAKWINPKEVLIAHGYLCRAKLRRDEIWSV